MITIKLKLSLAALLSAILINPPVFAGEKNSKDSEKEIQWEISYLAKRLLDLKGTDSYTIEGEAITKPYIGICSDMKKPGIAITCVTPDSQASKAGIKTGDLMTSINGVSMADQHSHPIHKKGFGKGEGEDESYWKIVNTMKVGDKLKIEMLRAGEPLTVNVTVGTLHHPAYKLEVRK